MLELTLAETILPCGAIRWKTSTEGAGFVTVRTPDSGTVPQPGSALTLRLDGRAFFTGYLFSVERKDGERILTAYDQLRYLLYRDTKVFTGRTAGEMLREICGERGLTTGTVEDGGYRIPSLIMDNQPLLDILLAAMDQTEAASGNKLVLLDEDGKLSMRLAEKMRLDTVLNGSGLVSGYSLRKDIGTDTYNRVRIIRKNRKTGYRDIFVKEDAASISQWGVLQYCAQVTQNTTDGEIAALMESVLGQKNRAYTAMTLQCAGEIGFRAGWSGRVELPEEGVSGWYQILEAEHQLEDGGHRMTLTMAGTGEA